MMKGAGLISMGAFIPGEPMENPKPVLDFLQKHTLFPKAYIQEMEKTHRLPGKVETNAEGWENQPWFETWLHRLPDQKKENPFQGTQERRRVPLDPRSLKESIHPHPMIPSDAETLAGTLALVQGQIDPDEIDLVLAHSHIPDFSTPANVSLIQHKLGLQNAGAYSIDTCCSSFVTMLEVASALIRAGVKRKVLIISSYIGTHVMDRSNYYSVAIGDAAIAGVVAPLPESLGYVASHSTSHGDRHDGIILYRRRPEMHRQIGLGPSYEQEFATFYNSEACKVIADEAKKDMQEVVFKTLEKAQLKVQDIELMVTHQPTHWAPETWRKAIGVPREKFYETYKKYANVATCSAGLNLYEAIRAGLGKEGDLALIASSGAGENHMAVLERLSPDLIRSIRKL